MLEQSMLFAEDTHASHFRYPGSEEAQMMTATSGRKLLDCCERLNRAGPFLKMFTATLPWASTRCYLSWKKLVTPQKRLLFQLAPSDCGIDGIEYGLLPTARASIYKHRKWWIRERSFPNLEELPMRPGYEHLAGEPINPQWLEWHMGFPIGWTEVKPSETQ